MLNRLLEAFSDVIAVLVLLLITVSILFLFISSSKKYQEIFDKGVKTYLGRSNPLPSGGK